MDVGYALICEEHPPERLVQSAMLAEQAGFAFLTVSDHFHPWLDEQGNSPFAWTVLGALAQATSLPLMTAVTCPIHRYHPAVVAQAAATVARMCPAGFTLGLGSGEALNEHVVGGEWPAAITRLDMLEEAVEMVRRLWTGEQITHRGDFFDVDRARLYTLPERPPRLAIAGSGEHAIALAARTDADFMTVGPSGDAVAAYRDAGGSGRVIGQGGLCFDPDPQAARERMRDRWRQSVLGWDVNADLPTPAGFAAATETVRSDDVADGQPLGADLEAIRASLRQFRDAGFDAVALHNVGADQRPFLDFAATELLPGLRLDDAAA